MLELLQTYSACPATGFHHLLFSGETLLLYPSADAVTIVNARTLRLVRVLAFWENFPGTMHTFGQITCISVDSGMKLVAAAMNNQIAAWSLSGVQDDTWRIHSSLILSESNQITALDSKSGLLAVASQGCLSVYTLIMENDLLVWSPKWTSSVVTPSKIHFSPSLMCIAAASKDDNAIRIYSTTTGRQTQSISHPRPVVNITWRHSQASSRGDLVLYTVTADSVLRIFSPVLDAPQYLQLHAAVDLYSSVPFSVALKHSDPAKTSIFWLDRGVVGSSISHVLADNIEHQEDSRTKRLKDIKDEGWDLFIRVLDDGSIIVTAVANIDHRPPTLLRHFTLQHSLPRTLAPSPSYLSLLPDKQLSSLTLVTAPPLTSYAFSPLSFFDAHASGLSLCVKSPVLEQNQRRRDVNKLVRTPEGHGVGILREDGGIETWRVVDGGARFVASAICKFADLVVVVRGGKDFATYSSSEGSLTLHCSPPSTLDSLPPISAVFSMPTEDGPESIFAITSDFSILHIRILLQHQQSSESSPSSHHEYILHLHSHTRLPLPCTPRLILPVDPMAWGQSQGRGPLSWLEHDVLLSVSSEGELAFWVPEELKEKASASGASPTWRCTGRVRTGRSGIRMACCSSAKKSALVVPAEDGEELTIWDSHESEFASGLEYVGHFSSSINDLDWTSTPDSQSILAVGFLHHVDLLCQQRMTYFDEGPGWAMCWKIDLGNIIPHGINDSIWLANGSMVVAAGPQLCLFGQREFPPENTPCENLFEFVARQNGPLMHYHPQMLLQCLLWEKVELVKEIIVKLAKDLEAMKDGTKPGESWMSLPIESFLKKDQLLKTGALHKKSYMLLFNGPEQNDDFNDEGFCRPLVLKLIESLEAEPLPHLTPNEQAHLLVLIQTTLEIEEQRRALDSNGLRYLISMRSFYILNQRASAPSSPNAKEQDGIAIPRKSGRRDRLRYRDMIWAFHSESQDLLLNASTAACDGKMCWSDARALGVAIWLNSVESMKFQMEIIARNEYMAGDNRDPVSCSLYYFALGKVKLVQGLWRQAAWHREQAMMLKFLSNDFMEPRWRTAALKNAYALLSKQRFEYAAAFFLLGSSLKDAVNVCLKYLSDFQLAIALCRIVEQSNEGPLLLDVLNNNVLPIAFKDGNRWLASWAFWLLHRRDLAVRILVTPLQDIANTLDIRVTEIGEPHYDDPGLALMFSQLRSKTLQAAKGTSEISGRQEFNFVLQIARVFCRMGCHALGLDLVRTWSFERPSTVIHEDAFPPVNSEVKQPPSPTVSRRSMFALEPAMRRRSSIMIDMEIPSLPPTRSASPDRSGPSKPPAIAEETIKEEGDLFARKAGLGNLLKSAKQDVTVPEFDMSAFF